MGVVEKRAKRQEEFRREILDSVREIFINDGYDGFSMRKLAEKIGYSPTTIYIYFKNKEDLLFALCEEFFADFFSELKRIRSISQDPVETLRQALLYLIEFGLKNPDQYKVLFFSKSDVYGTQEDFGKSESMARNTSVVFKEMIRDCIKAGRFQELDEKIIAPALVAASQGLVTMILYRTDPFQKRSKAIVRSLVNALLKGYQK